MKYAISDLGEQNHDLLDRETGDIMHIPRYGVWEIIDRHAKPQVIETSDDLDALKKKYPTASVFTI
jgi:hypothetical protein